MKGKSTLLFVDAVEGDVARLLLGEQSFSLPTALLPAEAGEGSWVRMRVEVVPPPPDRTETLRKRLGRGDPGGDIKL